MDKTTQLVLIGAIVYLATRPQQAQALPAAAPPPPDVPAATGGTLAELEALASSLWTAGLALFGGGDSNGLTGNDADGFTTDSGTLHDDGTITYDD